jgi:hypothetical protein
MTECLVPGAPVPRAPLRLRPIARSEARRFVALHHSHNHAPSASVFQIGAVNADGALVGVVIAGVPLARQLMDGVTLEITRVATTGHPNACSKLYAAAVRAAQALGYRRLVTYTLASERATALRATGWHRDETLRTHDPHGWQRHPYQRGRTISLFGVHVPTEPKQRWWKHL